MVPHPNGRALSPEGEDVPDNVWWQRRLRDGDVVVTVPAAAPVQVHAEIPAAPAPAETPIHEADKKVSP